MSEDDYIKSIDTSELAERIFFEIKEGDRNFSDGIYELLSIYGSEMMVVDPETVSDKKLKQQTLAITEAIVELTERCSGAEG